ncbi:hypothetical protein EMCRGX_G024811 [Ephydatia muelleri]
MKTTADALHLENRDLAPCWGEDGCQSHRASPVWLTTVPPSSRPRPVSQSLTGLVDYCATIFSTKASLTEPHRSG